MEVKITKDFIEDLNESINQQNAKAVKEMLQDLHPADIAELFDELSTKEQSFVIDLLDNEISADILLELEEDDRRKFLKTLTAKEIAEDVINEMDTDDAVDVINELSDEKKDEVIAQLEDQEHAREIVDLLRYDEDTAGGLMGKELIKVNKDWSVITAVKQMRKQAEDLEEVFSIYVVDEDEKLLGTLSLKRLLTTSANTKVADVYNEKIQYVKTYTKDMEVAKVIEKYDLYEVPVVDELMRLVGVITVDDVIDVIREEAEENYQLAAGITQNVDSDDNILKLTRARLPWLLLALVGSFVAVNVSQSFSDAMNLYPQLFFFTPLVAAMAGNVGVQSSAIIVQGLANSNISGSIWKRLGKEMLLALLNSTLLAFVLLLATHFLMSTSYEISSTIVLALVIVMILASLIGTFIPIMLHKYGVDPAIATGPFITTSNDIFGLLIYFSIAKMILGF
ncbi:MULTISPECIES: magnesium transporter [Empedobacter]|uniref:Magnesium transporter MgtE n=1 Tax=Empedobacter falsenii TaxID=343874 RepID=A0A376G946_9FLAO|nr:MULTISPECIES: magnesium transporter [Empedobacter]MDH0659319.1 magnesium transporter [Empedobacter sp. GD03865]MDH1601798.1 magnesium transporter [Empedobacter sp. GD03739]MDM1041514.1 magnesium transporter [Empedobacter brevis]MDM1135093.1 magnesium transporter [Empedobacter sp. R750]RRT91845.1 magnesium transporter [Empedobacter falsenii]